MKMNNSNLANVAPNKSHGHADVLLGTPINWRLLVVIVILFPFIPPTLEGLEAVFGTSAGRILSQFLTYWKYMSLAAIVLYFVIRIRQQSIIQMVPSLFIIVLVACLFLSTFLNGGGVPVSELLDITCMAALFVFADCLPKKKFSFFIRACYFCLTLSMLANSMTIYLCYPNGLYQAGYYAGENTYYLNPNYYLFGLDNVCFMYSLAGCSMGLIYRSTVGHIGLLLPISYAFIFGAFFYTGAGTAIAVTICLIAFMVLFELNKTRFMTYRFVLVLSGVLFVSICLMNTLGVFEGLLSLIGKDSTFSNRTFIWAAVFQACHRHELFGFGLSDAVMHTQLGLASGSVYISNIGHVHNVLLEFYFRGGLIGVLAFLLILIGPIRRMQRYSSSRIAQLVSLLFLLLWATCMFEFRLNTYTFWLVPICIWHIGDLVDLASAKESPYV